MKASWYLSLLAYAAVLAAVYFRGGPWLYPLYGAGVMLFFAAGLFWARDRRRITEQIDRGERDRCPRCDFDMSGLASITRCPECGEDVGDAAERARVNRRQFNDYG